jgi:hypothetical protein
MTKPLVIPSVKREQTIAVLELAKEMLVAHASAA